MAGWCAIKVCCSVAGFSTAKVSLIFLSKLSGVPLGKVTRITAHKRWGGKQSAQQTGAMGVKFLSQGNNSSGEHQTRDCRFFSPSSQQYTTAASKSVKYIRIITNNCVLPNFKKANSVYNINYNDYRHLWLQ